MTSAHHTRIARLSLTSADVEALAQFYERAFGCRRIKSEHLAGSAFEAEMSISGGAKRILLGLGRQQIEILAFDEPGRAYPAASSSADLVFQHFAIVVGEMDRALQHLCNTSGWVPISVGGAQRLPESSGGVCAFKFRDPEGHPLELLSFPAAALPPIWKKARGSFLGIDHTAISVSNTATSVGFYETLGYRVVHQSINQGNEQDRLDDLRSAVVTVTTLELADATPHLELLCYEGIAHGYHAIPHSNDIAATRIVLGGAKAGNQSVRDPDGHVTQWSNED